jgi:hypothetical protein
MDNLWPSICRFGNNPNQTLIGINGSIQVNRVDAGTRAADHTPARKKAYAVRCPIGEHTRTGQTFVQKRFHVLPFRFDPGLETG